MMINLVKYNILRSDGARKGSIELTTNSIRIFIRVTIVSNWKKIKNKNKIVDGKAYEANIL